MRPGHLNGISSMKPKRGFGLVPMPGPIPPIPVGPKMPSLPLIPPIPLGPISPPPSPPAPSPPAPSPPAPAPAPTPGPAMPPGGYPYGYPPYPGYYAPYASFPTYASELELEFAPARRKPVEEKIIIKEETKPKTLVQHFKDWLAGK